MQGTTGPVRMNPNGNRVTDLSILDLDPDTGQWREARIYRGAGNTLENVSAVRWPGGRAGPPSDWPACGVDGSLCIEEKKDISLIILSIVTSCLVVILALSAAFIYKHYKVEADIARMYWKVRMMII